MPRVRGRVNGNTSDSDSNVCDANHLRSPGVILHDHAASCVAPEPQCWVLDMPNGLKTAVLLGALSGLLLAIGQYAGGPQGLVIAFGLAAAMNFFSYWFADKLVLKM